MNPQIHSSSAVCDQRAGICYLTILAERRPALACSSPVSAGLVVILLRPQGKRYQSKRCSPNQKKKAVVILPSGRALITAANSCCEWRDIDRWVEEIKSDLLSIHPPIHPHWWPDWVTLMEKWLVSPAVCVNEKLRPSNHSCKHCTPSTPTR